MIPDGIRDIIDFSNGHGGIFFIYCEEPFIRKIFKKEISEIEGLTEQPYFYDLSENKNALPDALAMSKELGFFGASRVIVVDGCENGDAATIDKVVENIDKTVESNYLVLIFSEMDKRRKSTSVISSNSKFFHIPEADKKYKERFIRNRVGTLTIPDDIISNMLDSKTISLMEINSEIEKLLIFADMKDVGELSYQDCENIISWSEESKIYDVPALLAIGDKSSAISKYREFIRSDSEQKIIPVLIALFFNHFKTVMEILGSDQSDYSIKQIVARNRAFYLKSSALRKILLNTKKKNVISALRKLSEIELTLKGGEGTCTSNINIDVEQFMVTFF